MKAAAGTVLLPFPFLTEMFFQVRGAVPGPQGPRGAPSPCALSPLGGGGGREHRPASQGCFWECFAGHAPAHCRHGSPGPAPTQVSSLDCCRLANKSSATVVGGRAPCQPPRSTPERGESSPDPLPLGW